MSAAIDLKYELTATIKIKYDFEAFVYELTVFLFYDHERELNLYFF